MMGENYLTVHMWDSNFNPYEHEISSTLVWARLLEIPIQYFHPEAVMKIGKRMGKPIRVDQATRTGARSDYARVCVQVDLTKPLLSKFRINGKRYFIQYEGLERICLQCGRYTSHGTCQCSKPAEPMEDETESSPKETEEPQPEKVYGEWMIAKRKPRNGRPEATTTGRGAMATTVRQATQGVQKSSGSRFQALQNEETEGPTKEALEEPSGAVQEEIGPQPRSKGKEVPEKEHGGKAHPNSPNPTTPQARLVQTGEDISSGALEQNTMQKDSSGTRKHRTSTQTSSITEPIEKPTLPQVQVTPQIPGLDATLHGKQSNMQTVQHLGRPPDDRIVPRHKNALDGGVEPREILMCEADGASPSGN
ncbi:unnamed protein product [Linum tenue]|nr:unnamed protein product [Linum tenue]